MKTNVTYERDGENIIYCNIQSTNTTNVTQRMDINISRSMPIIENPSQYYLSVVRFQVPTYKYPLIVMPDPLTNPLIVSMNFGGVVKHATVSFTQTNFDPIYNDLPNRYFSYQQFITDINTAISSCITQFPLGPPFNVNHPKFVYNAETELFSLIAPQVWGDVYPYTSLVIPHIFFNRDLYVFFQNLLTIENTASVSSLDNLIIITDTINNTIPYPPVPATPAYEMKQEYSTLWAMTGLTNITLASNNLPIVAENVMDSVFSSGTNSSSTTFKILNDFEIVYDKAGVQRSVQYYQPNVYRYTDMVSSSNLYNINLQFYLYSSVIKKFVPLYIDPTFAVTIKLMFKRKELNY